VVIASVKKTWIKPKKTLGFKPWHHCGYIAHKCFVLNFQSLSLAVEVILELL